MSETWLNTNISDSELFDASYIVYRRDRNYELLGCQRGGGVLIAASKRLSSSFVHTAASGLYEDIWTQVCVDRAKIIICCVYIPPNSSLQCYESFCETCESMRNKYDDHRFILYGDFNLPNVQWTFEDDILAPVALRSPTAEVLLDTMAFLELQQINPHHNNIGRVLDLVFADEFQETSVLFCSDSLIDIDAYHPAIECYFNINIVPELKNNNFSTFYHFDIANFEDLNNFYNLVDWDFLTSLSDIDLATERFYSALFEGIDTFVPKITAKGMKYPSWFDRDLRKLIAKKNKLYKKFKKNGSSERL